MCVCVFARLCQQAHQIYHRYQEKCPALAARDSFANFSSSSCGCFSTIELQSSRSIKISRPHDTSLVPATITLFMLLKPSDKNAYLIYIYIYIIQIYTQFYILIGRSLIFEPASPSCSCSITGIRSRIQKQN